MKKILELGGEGEVKRVERPSLVCPKRVDPAVILLGEERTLNIIPQGVVRQLMIFPNSNSPSISYNPPHAFMK